MQHEIYTNCISPHIYIDKVIIAQIDRKVLKGLLKATS